MRAEMKAKGKQNQGRNTANQGEKAELFSAVAAE
jgi:hypothetical protein